MYVVYYGLKYGIIFFWKYDTLKIKPIIYIDVNYEDPGDFVIVQNLWSNRF